MDRIADIVVIVDPTSLEQPSVAKAHALAKRLGACVELLACETKYSRETRAAAELAAGADALCDGLETLLDRLADPLRAGGIEVSAHVIAGDPLHECVQAWLRDSPADLIIKDTHHHSLAKRTFLTNTDWCLIRSCSHPLLLSKARAWDAPPVFVAAVDPGHPNDAAAALDQEILNVTASLARSFAASVHVAHAFFPATITVAKPGGLPAAVGVSAEALAAETARNRAEIVRLAAPYGISTGNVHVEMGIAAQYLPSIAAQCRADLLVMGAVARSGLKRILIGSTAERVLEWLPCDVLVVKPPDFADLLPI